MEIAILLSLAASFCTATSSVLQRLAATSLERSGFEVRGFDAWLVFRLARRSAWLLGLATMVVGFVLQVSALHFGPLALVQPILAVELLFVFGYLAVLTRCRGVRWREWLAAAAMSAGVSVFLRAASPSGGQPHAQAVPWWIAGLVTLLVMLLAIAAVIKELSSHVDGGPGAIFGNWSVYVLMGAGAAMLLLTSHAMTAGPLAASQPGFAILDPVTAVLLGVFLFGERLHGTPAAVTAEALGLVVLVVGVWTLSRSELITDGAATRSGGEAADGAGRELTRRSR
jgi:drug/metabolite transporter (DMT)-like permease